MAVYKRGDVYWYEFTFKGDRVRESSRQGNKTVATQMMAAHRTRLAKGEVGIVERTAAPTLTAFAPRFEKEIETACNDKPATVTFYKEKLRRLLEFDPLANCRLDHIDEELVDAYKQGRSRQMSRYGRLVTPASVNRELATLRRLLRLAKKWKAITAVPEIKMLRGEGSADSGGRRKGFRGERENDSGVKMNGIPG
jgi:Phage integrase, N-terminal SAM-like domain